MAFSTKKSLLSKIKEGDDVSWYEFYLTYSPLIWLRGGDHGLKESEKEDLIQETLLSVFNGRERFHYDPAKGRFRNYIKKIIDRRSIDILRQRKNNNQSLSGASDEGLMDIAVSSEMEKLWEAEWREHIYNHALSELKTRIEPETYQAFELYAISNWPPKQVAEFLGIKINSVYVSKNRAIEKLKVIISEMEV